ncbi:DUF5131 family protein [Chitinimonas koreensis]|uniref:DUF5131 family protein n=1 Tax=Chitinimonas koreensis TaxID=356302 RepID=UPI0004198419|nr:phage Gp37/Gp68 family protein [Chitinimonas koreensis]QNM94930.1 phage Gp37/Gp68 family protein [Chitinimonas koreensis]
MADRTGIEWTNATWNPVTGCTKVSQGCKHCYAKHQIWPRLSAMPNTVYHGREFEQVECHLERLAQPLRWAKPRRIFVNSMSDLFHEAVPDDFIIDVFETMAHAQQHTFQVLTKRPARMAYLLGLQSWDVQMEIRDRLKYTPAADTLQWPLPNVWLGVSVEDQATADERIPLLLQAPAAVRWISAEPLLGPVTIFDLDGPVDVAEGMASPIHWVVAGGESGPGARPMSIRWARDLRDQCAAASVPFLFKQWGEWAPARVRPSETSGQFAFGDYEHQPDRFVLTDRYPRAFTSFGARAIVERVGKKTAGRLLDGHLHDAYPEVRHG